MKKQTLIPRRHFLKCSAGGLAAMSAIPGILPASTAKSTTRPAPSDRVVVGLIGCGSLGRGHHLSSCMIPNPRIEVGALCDVDMNHLYDAARRCKDRTGKRVPTYKDFRQLVEQKDLDAVVIATPDHWHALNAIAAMENGLDVYCEKPLSLTIEEGKAMVAAARRYGTVFQTGSMQRSQPQFRRACELVRNNKIGKLHTVTTHIGKVPTGRPKDQWQAPQTPPAGLDWDFWLGPAPYADYTPNRCHYQFRWYWDYSGGKMTDWGAHHNDIAQWGLNMDHFGPIMVDSKGVYSDKGPYDAAIQFEVTYYYDTDVILICSSEPCGQESNGIKFIGEDGWIFVNRRKIEASDPDILKIELGPDDVRLYNTGDNPNSFVNHYKNWLDCIQTRQRCICDVEVGHRSCTVCHLGNISLRLGRRLKWNAGPMTFFKDQTATDTMMGRPMRPPWHL
ncbi:MAG: Gfo/Idh/MocA family oxidoreductase [Planctomycetota bacterium]|nr:MAG: Gfo/Idh/MocA family oxidoreductase [Planctomycetota bacterium]